MIKCAHCKEYHDSVSAVRECAAFHNAAKAFEKELVEQTKPAPKMEWVPEGRYALETKNGLRFYKIDRPETGRWAGYTFVTIEHGDQMGTRVTDSARKGKILRAIGENPQEAMLRYGRELKQCGHCGKNLRNKVSRERGIGPVCFGKVNW